jgi:hypothetical protein
VADQTLMVWHCGYGGGKMETQLSDGESGQG